MKRGLSVLLGIIGWLVIYSGSLRVGVGLLLLLVSVLVFLNSKGVKIDQ